MHKTYNTSSVASHPRRVQGEEKAKIKTKHLALALHATKAESEQTKNHKIRRIILCLTRAKLLSQQKYSFKLRNQKIPAVFETQRSRKIRE